jgi:transcription antitermination factor NusG
MPAPVTRNILPINSNNVESSRWFPSTPHCGGGKIEISALSCPLFPCYVFVQIALERKLELLRVPGVVDLISFQGKPVPLLSGEIETLQSLNATTMAHLCPCPYLQAGRKVRIRRGALEGLDGIFVRRRGHSRIVLSVSLIQRSVAIEIEDGDVEPIS